MGWITVFLQTFVEAMLTIFCEEIAEIASRHYYANRASKSPSAESSTAQLFFVHWTRCHVMILCDQFMRYKMFCQKNHWSWKIRYMVCYFALANALKTTALSGIMGNNDSHVCEYGDSCQAYNLYWYMSRNWILRNQLFLTFICYQYCPKWPAICQIWPKTHKKG